MNKYFKYDTNESFVPKVLVSVRCLDALIIVCEFFAPSSFVAWFKVVGGWADAFLQTRRP